ncbi:MAG: hypothetical protein MZW92_39705 [Comamonadaceae bacterium]|nr:hypothetical protein [Comamonadaceae bacterium]
MHDARRRADASLGRRARRRRIRCWMTGPAVTRVRRRDRAVEPTTTCQGMDTACDRRHRATTWPTTPTSSSSIPSCWPTSHIPHPHERAGRSRCVERQSMIAARAHPARWKRSIARDDPPRRGERRHRRPHGAAGSRALLARGRPAAAAAALVDELQRAVRGAVRRGCACGA